MRYLNFEDLLVINGELNRVALSHKIWTRLCIKSDRVMSSQNQNDFSSLPNVSFTVKRPHILFLLVSSLNNRKLNWTKQENKGHFNIQEQWPKFFLNAMVFYFFKFRLATYQNLFSLFRKLGFRVANRGMRSRL